MGAPTTQIRTQVFHRVVWRSQVTNSAAAIFFSPAPLTLIPNVPRKRPAKKGPVVLGRPADHALRGQPGPVALDPVEPSAGALEGQALLPAVGLRAATVDLEAQPLRERLDDLPPKAGGSGEFFFRYW